MMLQKQGKCPKDGTVLAQKQGTNHIFHLIMTLVSFGIWGLVWLLVLLLSATKPYKCTKCGLDVKIIN